MQEESTSERQEERQDQPQDAVTGAGPPEQAEESRGADSPGQASQTEETEKESDDTEAKADPDEDEGDEDEAKAESDEGEGDEDDEEDGKLEIEKEKEAAQEEVKALEGDPPEDLADWPSGDAKYETFGGPEHESSYDEAATSELGPSDVRHLEDGSVTVGGEKVDDPEEYKGEPIPGGPTDPDTPSVAGEQDLSEESSVNKGDFDDSDESDESESEGSEESESEGSDDSESEGSDDSESSDESDD